MMNSKKDDKKNILPFIEGLTFPMTMINSHLREFLKLIGFVACLTSLVTIIGGRSNYCGVHSELSNTFYCPFTTYSVFFVPVIFFVVLFCSGFVYNKWQCIFSKNVDFAAAVKEKTLKKNIKASCFLLIYLLLWCVIDMGFFALSNRVPNPDWHKELLFFTGVSLGILLVIILLFNFVVFQHILSGGSFFSIKKTFLPIFDNIYKPMFWFFVYFFIFLYLLKMVIEVFSDKAFPIWFNMFFGEISFYIVFYAMIAVFSAALFYQEKKLFGEEK